MTKMHDQETVPLYKHTRDELVTIILSPLTPDDVRAEARLEFDAKSDQIEGR